MTVARGTTNANRRGNTTDRRRRREWLVTTFRADVDVSTYVDVDGQRQVLMTVPTGQGDPACRCYRCGRLLTVDTVSPDRIIPGCEGGTYARGNIRPCCDPCQQHTGGVLGNERKRALKAVPA